MLFVSVRPHNFLRPPWREGVSDWRGGGDWGGGGGCVRSFHYEGSGLFRPWVVPAWIVSANFGSASFRPQ